MRNPECRHYYKCLTAAAHADVIFNCDGCKWENDTGAPGFTDGDIAGARALAFILSKPKKLTSYLRFEKSRADGKEI